MSPSVGGPLTRYPSNCMAERVRVAPCSHAQSVHADITGLGNKLLRPSARMLMRALRRSSDSGSAAVRVRLPTSTFDDAVAARIVNEFLFAPTRLSFDTVLVMTGGGDPPSGVSWI
jgi:hypothetical protein